MSYILSDGPTPGDIWQGLKTFLLVTPGGSRGGQRPGMLRNTLCGGTAPPQRMVQPDVSAGPRLSASLEEGQSDRAESLWCFFKTHPVSYIIA